MLELIVASAVFLVAVVGVWSLVFEANTAARQSLERTQAVNLAREGLAAARQIKDNNFDGLTAGNYGLSLASGAWALSGTSDSADGFTRTLTVSDVSTNVKEVLSRVTWNITASRPQAVELRTRLTRRVAAVSGQAANFDMSASDVYWDGANTIRNVFVYNTNGTVVLDKVRISWPGSGYTLNRVRIAGSTRWSGSAASNQLLELSNYTFNTGSWLELELRFSDNPPPNGTFNLTFIFSDGSSVDKSFYLYNQAEILGFDGVSAWVQSSNIIRGVYIYNLNGRTSLLTTLVISWGGNYTLNRVRIAGSNRWSGTATSGATLNISDYTLSGWTWREMELRFNGSAVPPSYTMQFIFSDGSSATKTFYAP